MRNSILLIICIITFSACQDAIAPKPKGYFRIDLPEKSYNIIDTLPFPFQFKLPQYAYPNLHRTKTDSNFFNIDFTRFDARLHLSYVPIKNNLPKLLEDARTLVYKHVSKAQDIRENIVYNDEERVFGTFYEIAGNAASGSQFFVTDSSKHFLRGALYFNVEPNYDSIAPVQTFIDQDISVLLETLSWED